MISAMDSSQPPFTERCNLVFDRYLHIYNHHTFLGIIIGINLFCIIAGIIIGIIFDYKKRRV